MTVAFVLEVKAGNTLSCLVTNSHANAGGSSNSTDGPPPYPLMPGCYPTQSVDVLYMFYLVLVIFEFGVLCPLVLTADLSLSTSVIFLLVLIQAKGHSSRMSGITSGLSRSLYRDSLLFVICLLCEPCATEFIV